MEKKLYLLLADDDDDDCFFFAKALEQVSISTTLITVEDGEKLMDHLIKTRDQPPDILFLDINMPRKKGSQCLVEIKSNKDIKEFPIIIYSTCLNDAMADEFYKKGAYYCMRKGELSVLIKSLQYMLQLLIEKNFSRPAREQFIIHSQEV